MKSVTILAVLLAATQMSFAATYGETYLSKGQSMVVCSSSESKLNERLIKDSIRTSTEDMYLIVVKPFTVSAPNVSHWGEGKYSGKDVCVTVTQN